MLADDHSVNCIALLHYFQVVCVLRKFPIFAMRKPCDAEQEDQQ